MKKQLTAVLTAWMLAAGMSSAAVSAAEADTGMMPANPIISRGVPAYSETGNAADGNDAVYYTSWQASAPDYLAYDLSGVPETQRQQVLAVWYNDSTFDKLGSYASKNAEPIDYVIEINAAAGGTYPESGWEEALSVSGNLYSSRQHLIDLNGCNWIRLRVTEAEGCSVKLNFDVHDAAAGVHDSWVFFGDSITAGGMVIAWGESYAARINKIDPNYLPAAQNGGIGGIRSIEGRESIDAWLKDNPVHFVSIAYGTNDCWGNPDSADAYYDNTKYMIDAILDAGKVPVLPTIPASTNGDVGPNVSIYNEKVRQLYAEYGNRLVQGPDFEAFFTEHPEYLSSDGVHPSFDGYEEMKAVWAETMYETVYSQYAGGNDTPAQTGDLNGDGSVTLADVVLLQKHLLTAAPLNDAQAARADLNADGALTAADLSALKAIILTS